MLHQVQTWRAMCTDAVRLKNYTWSHRAPKAKNKLWGQSLLSLISNLWAMPRILWVFCSFLPNKSFIDYACSVKMAWYWPCSFFASFSTSTPSRSMNKAQKKNLANIQPSLPHAWSITHIQSVFSENKAAQNDVSRCCRSELDREMFRTMNW